MDRPHKCHLIWTAGTAGVLATALAELLPSSSLFHSLGGALWGVVAGLLLWQAAALAGMTSPRTGRLGWPLLCLPALGLSTLALVCPLTGLDLAVFFAALTGLTLLALARQRSLDAITLGTALLLCWFCCYCALSPLCLSPDSYSYYEMAKTLFSDFGRVSTIRQYVQFTDYGISFPYLYPLLLAVTDVLTGWGMYCGVLVNIVASLLAALLFLPLSRQVCGTRWPGLMAATALLTNRKYLSEVLSGRAIPVAVLCVVALLCLLSRSHRWSRKNLFLAGLLAGGLLRLVLDGLEHALPAVRKTAFPLSAALLAALCLFSLGQARQPLQALSGPREGVYVAELDGWFSDGQTIQEAAQLLENGDYFSTYASALETIHGTFQPTGTDYIIHALGDGQRADYLANFLGGEYPYAVTIYKEYTAWEWWVQRANWFFYRELYANYAPLQTAGYAQLWQRQEGGAILEDMDYTLTTQRLDEDRVSIRIELPPEFAEQRFVADVALTYETAPDGWSLHRAVMVEDGTLWGYDGVYFLPEGSRTLNIPISVKNGAGEVTLVASPQETSSLLGVDAQVERFFDQEKLDYAFSG